MWFFLFHIVFQIDPFSGSWSLWSVPPARCNCIFRCGGPMQRSRCSAPMKWRPSRCVPPRRRSGRVVGQSHGVTLGANDDPAVGQVGLAPWFFLFLVRMSWSFTSFTSTSHCKGHLGGCKGLKVQIDLVVAVSTDPESENRQDRLWMFRGSLQSDSFPGWVLWNLADIFYQHGRSIGLGYWISARSFEDES